ncbi:MAG: uracil-DNA glycosylase [Bacteroidetes bacterium]|nr:MAG: uracil-DNA glycosylase [Bacteroidota bacterium]
MTVKIEDSWKEKLQIEFEKPYFEKLTAFVKDEYQNQSIYPAGKLIFNAFEKCTFDDTKVVILGQDPYHGEGQANGLCFSVNDKIDIPPSLLNIFKEIRSDLGKEIPKSGNLERWATQGVLMLNATLTVRANVAGSHQKKGWEQFTDAVIQIISQQKEQIVFILWGAYAHSKGFFGNKHFSRTNSYLESVGKKPIEW